ncbi:MAG: hypothetical protein HZA78_08190 [Candidatus Schekmanbacteria bacterium]|nr:hypothetical protein [Candidatus Schekmanbacteria bacterium]
MLIVNSQNNVPIRLTQERWLHIVSRHPEMRLQQERVLETIEKPDLIQQGDFGELLAIRFYPKTPLTSKYLIAVYRETNPQDGFILTAYFTTGPLARRITIWKR